MNNFNNFYQTLSKKGLSTYLRLKSSKNTKTKGVIGGPWLEF